MKESKVQSRVKTAERIANLEKMVAALCNEFVRLNENVEKLKYEKAE